MNIPEKPKFPFKVSKTFVNGKIVIDPPATKWSAQQKQMAKEYQKKLGAWKKEVIKLAFKYEEKNKKLEKLVSVLKAKVKETDVDPEVLARKNARKAIAEKKAELAALRKMARKN